jgi:hypothetical protein
MEMSLLEYLKQNCQEIPDEIIHLKPITNYLVRDLQDLAKRFDIPYLDEHGKALKKNVLYSALSVPMGSVPMGSVPMGSVPMGSV